jgi:hypothetical protein
VNLTTLSELPEGTPIMTGTFSINYHPVTVLFDTGATHSFISTKFGNKIGLDIYPVNGVYMITTPGGNISSNQVCRSVPIQMVISTLARPKRNRCSFRSKLDDPTSCVSRYFFKNRGDRFLGK